jgi:DNA-binding winged helix-turn-helix (wHTH) protein
MTTNTVDVIRHQELPEAWLLATGRIAGVRVLPMPSRPNTHWADRPAPIWAFGWRDCQHVFCDILSQARQHGARAVAIGHPEWREQGVILREGGWVLPEPPRLEELLRWLVSTAAGPAASTNATPSALPAPTLRIHATLRYALVDDQQVPLQPRELSLLKLLSRGDSCCLTTADLSHALLGDAGAKQRRILAQHLHSLRQKLGRFGAHIEFTKDRGYRTWLDLKWLEIAPTASKSERPRGRGRLAAGS